MYVCIYIYIYIHNTTQTMTRDVYIRTYVMNTTRKHASPIAYSPELFLRSGVWIMIYNI